MLFRSCSVSAKRLTACLFYHRSDFLSSSFFEVFRFLSNLECSQFLGADRSFRTSIGSFRFTSSWDSEVILLSQRLALKYNTIHRAGCQHFFASFFRFFLLSPKFIFRQAPTPPLRPWPQRLPLPRGDEGVIYYIYIISKQGGPNHDTYNANRCRCCDLFK